MSAAFGVATSGPPVEPTPINSVGVIGAGLMGNGIAHVCALAGLPVVLLDVKPEALQRAMATIAQNLDRRPSSPESSVSPSAASTPTRRHGASRSGPEGYTHH